MGPWGAADAAIPSAFGSERIGEYKAQVQRTPTLRQAFRSRTRMARKDLDLAATVDLPSCGYAVSAQIGEVPDDALDGAADLVRSDRTVVVDRCPQRASDGALDA